MSAIEPGSAPYVFARHDLQRPAFSLPVDMLCRPVLCHNGCGVYYVAGTEEEMKPDDVCPDCNAPPKPWRIGEAEEITTIVHAAFGNLFGNHASVEFLRSKGPLVRVVIKAPIARGIVKNPPG